MRVRRNPISFDDARDLVEEIAMRTDGGLKATDEDLEIVRDLVLEHGAEDVTRGLAVANIDLIVTPTISDGTSSPPNVSRAAWEVWFKKRMIPMTSWTKAHWSKAILSGLWWTLDHAKEMSSYRQHVAQEGRDWGPEGEEAFLNETMVRDALLNVGGDEIQSKLAKEPLVVASTYSPVGRGADWIRATPRAVYVFSDGRPYLDPYREAERVFDMTSDILREDGREWSWESYNSAVQYFMVGAGPVASGARGGRRRIPRQNPSPNPRELAVSKFKEFWRQEPTKIGEFPSSFKIPARVHKLGRMIHVLYESKKTDPETMKKPKRPLAYIHESKADVFDLQGELDTATPDFIVNAEALVCLGQCLGFKWRDGGGDEHEAEGTDPLPDLWCTPDGHALLVIQSRRTVLAVMWGDGLRVEARGIVG